MTDLSLDTQQALWGSWAQGLCSSHFFDYRKQPSFSLHGLLLVPMGRFKQLLIMKGRGHKTREKQSRAPLGQGPGFLSGIHDNYL